MDIKGLVFMGISIVLLIFVTRLYFIDQPKMIYVPEYSPDGPRGHKRRKKSRGVCKLCAGCGKLNPDGYCCAKPLNDDSLPQCLPNLSKHKCEKSNTDFNNYEYKWCEGDDDPYNGDDEYDPDDIDDDDKRRRRRDKKKRKNRKKKKRENLNLNSFLDLVK